MKNKKSIKNFLIIFIVSFIAMEIIEFCIFEMFNIDIHQLEWGWLGFIILYGFKYHIFCCLIPIIWTGYKCRHNNCVHEHCDHDRVRNKL